MDLIRYGQQQRRLQLLADKLGVVCYNPCYHGRKGDANTVLFYTKEDEEYNRMLEKNGWPSNDDYKKPFWFFENTNVNGMKDLNFANQGKINLRSLNADKMLELAIRMALYQKEHTEYELLHGGFANLMEADEYNNDLNRKQIEWFYKLNDGVAYTGKFSIEKDRLQRIQNGTETVLTPYNGEFVYNFDCDFIVPVEGCGLEELIMEWNTEGKVQTIEKMHRKICTIGGIELMWK